VHEEEHLVAPALLEVDVDHVWLFAEGASAVLDDGSGAAPEDPVALTADLVLEVVVEIVPTQVV
jgi:hypothetical protein